MEDFRQDLPAKELLDRYSASVYRIAYAAVRNKEDAEDITQEVFLKYIKYINANKLFNDEEHRKAWILRVAVNCTKDFVKSAHYRRRADAELSDIAADIDSGASYEIEEKSEVYYAVQSLPEKYRIPIHLFYYEDMSTAQIAAATGQRESTVRSIMTRARKMLKEILQEEFT